MSPQLWEAEARSVISNRLHELKKYHDMRHGQKKEKYQLAIRKLRYPIGRKPPNYLAHRRNGPLAASRK